MSAEARANGWRGFDGIGQRVKGGYLYRCDATRPCIPPGANRAERRARRDTAHWWKTGSDPSYQFCAVCGVKRLPEPGAQP